MSDPANQRADGCSIFFTFLVLVFLLAGFFLTQRIFEPVAPAPVTEAIDSVRREKAQSYREQNSKFLSSVDKFHTDNNYSLENSMNEVLENYRSSLRDNKPQEK